MLATHRTEKSIYTQSGFICSSCGLHTKTYGGVIPDHCPSCNTVGSLKMDWNQQVTATFDVLPLPLVITPPVVTPVEPQP